MSTEISTMGRSAGAFGKRVSLAFKTDRPAEIAKRLKITYQGARNYLDGKMPSIEKLVEISDSTGYSIHWLLTGEGPDIIAGATLDKTDEASAKKGIRELANELQRVGDISPQLKRLFSGKSTREIAELLDVPESDVRDYFNGSLPTADVLVKIFYRTGVSLTWLLTNKGPQWVAPRADLGGERLSQESRSLQPRREAVGPSPEIEGTEDRMAMAYMQLLVAQNARIVEQNVRIIELLGEISKKVG